MIFGLFEVKIYFVHYIKEKGFLTKKKSFINKMYEKNF